MMRRFITGSIFALAAIAVATALKLLIGQLTHGDADALYLGAVAFVAWRTGARAGIFAVVLAGLAQAYFFLAPTYSFAVDDAADVFGLGSWTVEGTLVCLLVSALNARTTRADEARDVQRDVTLRTAEALAESERAYHTMFADSPTAMYLFDPVTLVVSGVNDAALRLYGYEREHFVGMRMLDLKPPEEHEMLRATLETQAHADFNGRVVHRRRDGKALAVQVMSRALMLDGKLTRLCAVIDQTEHERLEAQLRQAQKMDAIGRLAGGIAHDFNNMLTVIIGFGTALLEDSAPGSDMHVGLSEIVRAGNRSADLTQQLLAFSRQSPRRTVVTDVNDLVVATDKLVRRLVGEDIEVVTRLCATPCASDVDPSQVEQIIMNLVVNARDAMPSGGKLTIETSLVECDSAFVMPHEGMQPGRYVMLALSDNGTGMDAATLGRIFEPFFTTKSVGNGTGLGLAIVFGIVKQHAGHVSVHSEPGRGTTFEIYLPTATTRPAAAEERGAAVARGDETILVVEDEEQVLRLLAGSLRRNGYHVLTAADPQDAVRLCKAHGEPIALLLTDVIMPGMNGRELSETLVAMRPAMKVLFMSGYTDNVVLDHGINATSAFIQKPATAEAISRKVREVLNAA